MPHILVSGCVTMFSVFVTGCVAVCPSIKLFGCLLVWFHCMAGCLTILPMVLIIRFSVWLVIQCYVLFGCMAGCFAINMCGCFAILTGSSGCLYG